MKIKAIYEFLEAESKTLNTRLTITKLTYLATLASGAKTSGQVAKELNVSQAAACWQLTLLEDTGLVLKLCAPLQKDYGSPFAITIMGRATLKKFNAIFQ